MCRASRSRIGSFACTPTSPAAACRGSTDSCGTSRAARSRGFTSSTSCCRPAVPVPPDRQPVPPHPDRADHRPGRPPRLRRALPHRESYQRHLLQLGATDRLLGHLLDRLERDRALRQGSGRRGGRPRHQLPARARRPLVRAPNVEDIAPFPFFMKTLGQRSGRISDKPLRTIDVLPTIADVAGFSIPWHVDGRSALSPTSDAPAAQGDRRQPSCTSTRSTRPATRAAGRGARAEAAGLFGHSVELYGPRRDLVGRRVAGLDVRPAGETAHVVDAREYREVDPASGFVPAGHARRPDRAGQAWRRRRIAAALNGSIAATGRTFTLAGDDDEQFSLLLPERDFRAGVNSLQLLVLAAPRAPRACTG